MPQFGGDMSSNDTTTDPSNHVSIVKKDKETTTKFSSSFSTGTKQPSLVAIELRNLYVFSLEGAMMQGIEDTLTNAVEMDFLAADTDSKQVFLASMRSLKPTLYITD